FLGDRIGPYEAADVGSESYPDAGPQRLLKRDAMDGDALAVAHPGRCVGRIVIVIVDRQRGYVPRALFDHLRDLRVGELETMLNGVTTAIQGSLQARPVIGVAGDLAAPSVRLVHDGLELLDRQGGLRNERTLLIDPRPVRHVHLDPVRAVIQLLARRLARLDGAIDQLRPLRHLELGRIPFQHVATARRDRARRYEHARARNVALVDRLLDADVAISRALGFDIANRREALFQRTPRGHDRARHAVGRRELQQLHIVAA